jgi:glycerophosphoryl diester phosphodiesterase
MPLTTTRVTGRISLPDDISPERAHVAFTLLRYDTDAADDVTIIPDVVRAAIDAGGDIDVDLWPNARGSRATYYSVAVVVQGEAKARTFAVGKVIVPEAGPVDLNDIILVDPYDPATVAYIDIIGDAEAAADRAEAAADLADSEGNATIALEARQGAETARDSAVTAQGLAETASESATSKADVYLTVTAGRAAVADNVQFSVVSGNQIIRYRRDSSSTQTEMSRIYNTVGVDDPQRAFTGLFFLNPIYELAENGDLYIKFSPTGTAAYIRGGFYSDENFTAAQILADLAGMATPTDAVVGITSPNGVTDCIRLGRLRATTIYYNPVTKKWGWSLRAAKQTGLIKVIENDGGRIAAATETEEINRQILDAQIKSTGVNHPISILTSTNGDIPDLSGQSITFPADMIFKSGNFTHALTEPVVVDTTMASGARAVYLNMVSRTFIVKAWNTDLTPLEKQTFLYVAFVRRAGATLVLIITCPHTVGGGDPSYYFDPIKEQHAYLIGPGTGSSTTRNYVNYKTSNRTITFWSDSMLFAGRRKWIITEDVIFTFTGSGAQSLYWDTRTNVFVSYAYNIELLYYQYSYLVLVATVRDALTLATPRDIQQMGAAFPITINGKLPGEGSGTAQIENRPGAAVEGLAHTGLSAVAPENTLAAFRAAVRDGTYNIEMDMHWSSDNVAVIIHDTTVDDHSDGTGNVKDKTLAELKLLDAGSWFGAEFAGERIPSWDEALLLCKKLDANIHVEMKPTATLLQVQGVLASIKETGMTGRVTIHSFIKANLDKVLAEDPSHALGFLTMAMTDAVSDTAATLKTATNSVVVAAAYASITEAEVRYAHGLGLKVMAWTVDSAVTANALADMGVDGIISNALNIAEVLRSDEGV